MKAIVIYYNGQAPTENNVLDLRNYVADKLHYIGTSASATQVSISVADDVSLSEAVINATKPKEEPTPQIVCVKAVNNVIEKILAENPNIITARLVAELVERSNVNPMLRARLKKVIDENLEISHKEVVPFIKLVLNHE